MKYKLAASILKKYVNQFKKDLNICDVDVVLYDDEFGITLLPYNKPQILIFPGRHRTKKELVCTLYHELLHCLYNKGLPEEEFITQLEKFFFKNCNAKI